MAREFLLKQLYASSTGSAAVTGAAVDLSAASAYIDRREIIFGVQPHATAGSPAFPVTFEESSGSAAGGTWTSISLNAAIAVSDDSLIERFGKVTKQYVRAKIGDYTSAGSVAISAFCVPVYRES